VAWIKAQIGGRTALEIGAGNGALGRALGIPMIDNFMQRDLPDVVAHYRMIGQPTISYGSDVTKRDANPAVRAMRPQVVVASWVTHVYREDERHRGGNMYGVDELKILEYVETYIHVGCSRVHSPSTRKRWRPCAEIREPWLFGRGHDRVIYVWEKNGA